VNRKGKGGGSRNSQRGAIKVLIRLFYRKEESPKGAEINVSGLRHDERGIGDRTKIGGGVTKHGDARKDIPTRKRRSPRSGTQKDVGNHD